MARGCRQDDFLVGDDTRREAVGQGKRHECHVDLVGVDETEELVQHGRLTQGDRYVRVPAVPTPAQ